MNVNINTLMNMNMGTEANMFVNMGNYININNVHVHVYVYFRAVSVSRFLLMFKCEFACFNGQLLKFFFQVVKGYVPICPIPMEKDAFSDFRSLIFFGGKD
jgi:hypothetical protein